MFRLLAFTFLLLFISVTCKVVADSEIKYNVRLSTYPLLSTKVESSSVAVVSKYGQKFSCNWSLTNLSSSDDSPLPVTNENVSNFLSVLSKSDCLLLSKGWWTYEFCFRRHILQYHSAGKQRASETILGWFDSDYNWENLSDVSTSKPKHHTQFYTNGSICDLTNKRRETEVHFICTGTNQLHIISLDEPETCVYILKVSTPTLCLHPSFLPDKPIQPKDILCQPVVNENYYVRQQPTEMKNKTSHSLLVKSALKSSKRVLSFPNLHQRCILARNKRQMNSVRRSIGRFMKSISAFGVQAKQIYFSKVRFYPTISDIRQHMMLSMFAENFIFDPHKMPIWSIMVDISSGFARFSSRVLASSFSRHPVPSELANIAAKLGNTLLSIFQVFQTFLDSPKEARAIELLGYLNVTEIHESLEFVWQVLLTCRDRKQLTQIEHIVQQLYKKYGFTYPEEKEDLIKINADQKTFVKYILFELAKRSEPRIVIDHNTRRAKGLIKEVIAAFKSSIETVIHVRDYLELKEVKFKAKEQLEQTILHVLENLNFKVIMIRDIGHRNLKEDPESTIKTLKSKEILNIIQRAFESSESKVADDFEIFETPEAKTGLSIYFITPSGPKRKEENRMKELKSAYDFVADRDHE